MATLPYPKLVRVHTIPQENTASLLSSPFQDRLIVEGMDDAILRHSPHQTGINCSGTVRVGVFRDLSMTIEKGNVVSRPRQKRKQAA